MNRYKVLLCFVITVIIRMWGIIQRTCYILNSSSPIPTKNSARSGNVIFQLVCSPIPRPSTEDNVGSGNVTSTLLEPASVCSRVGTISHHVMNTASLIALRFG